MSARDFQHALMIYLFDSLLPHIFLQILFGHVLGRKKGFYFNVSSMRNFNQRTVVFLVSNTGAEMVTIRLVMPF